MEPGKRKWRLVVVEHRSVPRTGGVAYAAIRREARGSVRRIFRVVVIGLVAPETRGRNRGVVVVLVALRAIHSHVCAGQWEGGLVVIETRGAPASGRMADRAVRGES